MKLKINKINIVKLLTQIQDEGDIHSNSLATKAIKDFGLNNLHHKLQVGFTLGKNKYPMLYGCLKGE